MGFVCSFCSYTSRQCASLLAGPLSPIHYYIRTVLAQPECQPEIPKHVPTTYRTFKPKSSQTSFQSSFASFASTRRQASWMIRVAVSTSKQHCDLNPSRRVKSHCLASPSTQHPAIIAGHIKLRCQCTLLLEYQCTHSIDMPRMAVEVEQWRKTSFAACWTRGFPLGHLNTRRRRRI